MSRTHTRLRRRLAAAAQTGARRNAARDEYRSRIREAVKRLRTAGARYAKVRAAEAVIAVCEEIARSDVPLWWFAADLGGQRPYGAEPTEDNDEVRAMIAQLVARHLAGGTSGSVFRRERRAPH